MDFETFKKNWFAITLASLCLINISLYCFTLILVEKAANRVIEKLKKEPYSPVAPDLPTLNPDKVNPDIQPKKVDWLTQWDEERTSP